MPSTTTVYLQNRRHAAVTRGKSQGVIVKRSAGRVPRGPQGVSRKARSGRRPPSFAAVVSSATDRWCALAGTVLCGGSHCMTILHVIDTTDHLKSLSSDTRDASSREIRNATDSLSDNMRSVEWSVAAGCAAAWCYCIWQVSSFTAQDLHPAILLAQETFNAKHMAVDQSFILL